MAQNETPSPMSIDPSEIKGIIFDYGGTLDSGGDHWGHVIAAAYREAGVAVGDPEFREAYVFAERELARTRHILPAHDFHDMLLIKMRLELQHLAQEGLFPPAQIEPKASEIAAICYSKAKAHIEAAKPVLEALSAKWPLVVVSNFYGNIETVLEDFGIRPYFKAIIESAVLGIRKPDPRIFEHGVKALGILPSQTLVIGDSLRKDILPAEKIGCKAIWLKGKGWTPEEDAQLHPNTITDLGALLSLFAD